MEACEGKEGGVMALPIAPTPYLMGSDAERFDRIVADGLKNRVPLTLPKVDWDDIHRVQREVAAREGRTLSR